MIKAIIIDDEKAIREDLNQKIEAYFTDAINVVAKVGSVKEGLLAINLHKPDLVLLDIELEDGTGFDLLQQIQHKDFELIFITGFNNHAIKAIRVGALDYILKPVDDSEFTEAVKKAIDQKEAANLEQSLEATHDYFKGIGERRIVLKTTDTVYAVYEKDLLYCRSDGNYTTFYTNNSERIVVSKPLKKIEELLTEAEFIRCHQSYLVNRSYVRKYSKQGVLILADDVKVPVSSRRKDYALERIFK
ncbi:LytR/AlgR family response regulator transcription factor [Gilvibacter sp.]|uniref:LytR/AlgR family response regulator transcription factor n=1 Tax=Gilvibacter sp. TaxID=2729997 RepID=UPI003F49E934